MGRKKISKESEGGGAYQSLNNGPESIPPEGSNGGNPLSKFTDCLFPKPVRPDRVWVPEEECNIISRITFWWVGSLISLGNLKPLVPEDLWDVADRDTTASISARIDKAWEIELAKSKPSLAKALWRTVGRQFILSAITKLAHDCLQFMSPVLLQKIVQFLQDPDSPMERGIGLALLLFCCNIVQSLCVHSYFHRVYRVSIHVRAAVVSLIYRKSLRISSTARQGTSIGQIVNLQSNDAEKLSSLCIYVNVLWSGPFQIIGALGLLFMVIGIVPALCGLGVMLLLMPFSTFMLTFLTRVRKRLVLCTDARVKLISEVISGIKAIKLYAWEVPFRKRVDDLRDAEMKEIRTNVIFANIQRIIISSNMILVALVSFGAFTFLGHSLDASVAFPALALFNLMQFPLSMLPRQLNSFIQAGVSVDRLEKFLALPETGEVEEDPNGSPGSILLKDGNFSWSDKEESGKEPTLKDINLSVSPGQLLIIVGEVGSGKSSTLAAVLGEIHKISGSIFLNGTVAYTSQDPWIQNATLQENILMGFPMDREKYERVLTVCALREDLKQLPGGDQAEIGEKGINLSGGQKHRVALARAVYCEADIYLLDDPLSAVDTHVGRHLFDECINGELRGKTRVLVTHQLQYVEAADKIAVISNGSIGSFGTFKELRAQGVDFSQFKHEEEVDEPSVNETSSLITPPITTSTISKDTIQNGAANGKLSILQKNEKESKLSEKTPLLGKTEKTKAAHSSGSSTLVKQEHRAVGKVRSSLYFAYFKAWGPWYWMPLLVILAFTVAQSAKLGNDTWLAVWTEGVRTGGSSVYFYLGVYCITAISTALFAFLRNILVAFSSLNASKSLHRQLIDHTLRLPMSFFDSQPSGRLVNRFTRDTEQVDLNLPDTILSFLGCLFQVVFALGIIIYVTPLFIFPLIPVLLIYQAVQRFYIAASRELKRIDSTSRSPIFAHFGESVQGLSTIRAFRRQDIFIAENFHRIDSSTRAYFASCTANRWLGMRLEMLGSLAVFMTGFFCVWAHLPNAGFAGLALTNALTITGYMNWMVRMSAELETQMNSVERVLEYSAIETEAPPVVESNRPPSDWPLRGAIDAFGLVVCYRADLGPVLRNLSFSILGGEKVGICGRTGCGKTTLMMTIYRIMELESGKLLIDGLDVSKIGLYDLRKGLSLVPQDPVVFSGSVRLNLDPFGEASTDDELWQALRQAGISGAIEGLPGQLDADVSEGGSNFSTGQRQLLCMARALLRKSHILFLDEATSNVDSVTDAIIQKTIREAFRNCTVLTIAHRLHTIIDSDRVMLLEKGELAEFDTPAVLLEDNYSKFTGFVNQTLPEQAAALRNAAKSAAKRSLSQQSLLKESLF